MNKQKICIIGGGLTGLITAATLMKLDLEIDLITENIDQIIKTNRTTAISQDNYNNLRKLNVYLMLLMTQITMILFEMFISQMMFGFSFNLSYFLKIALLSIIFSYPIFIIFSKIDRVI